MSPENKQKLKYDFPDLFNARIEISCGDGWFEILHKIYTEISLYLNAPINKKLKEKFYVTQIKEKFGTLRFYVSISEPVIDDIINKYEDMSFDTCEICGKNATMRTKNGWIITICTTCADAAGGYTDYDNSIFRR